MSDQLALVGPSTPPTLKLTERQRFALELVAEKPRSSEELGAALHERRKAGGGSGHPADKRCNYCQSEGAAMGSRLREDGLVRFARKLSVWYLVEAGRPADPRPGPPSAQTDEIPF